MKSRNEYNKERVTIYLDEDIRVWLENRGYKPSKLSKKLLLDFIQREKAGEEWEADIKMDPRLMEIVKTPWVKDD